MTTSNDNDDKEPDLNVFGEPLVPCGLDPVTGFYRDGCCSTGPHDHGSHTVCAEVTQEFLAFSKSRGNNLMTPMPQYQFPGLKPGDRWCLCAERWFEAFNAGAAPNVVLTSTHQGALRSIDLSDLKSKALDLA